MGPAKSRPYIFPRTVARVFAASSYAPRCGFARTSSSGTATSENAYQQARTYRVSVGVKF
jgi:hypothetical protein